VEGRVLSDWVWELRVVRLDLSRKEFAELVGVSLGSVRNWEIGESLPVPLHLRALWEVAMSVGYMDPMRVERSDLQTGVQRGGIRLREEPD
jgi:transcriptional regulator with XRE-family HTH domain